MRQDKQACQPLGQGGPDNPVGLVITLFVGVKKRRLLAEELAGRISPFLFGDAPIDLCLL